MTETANLAAKLTAALNLSLEPVGVRFYGPDQDIPPEVSGLADDEKLKSYCQGLTRAARGRAFFGGAERLGCVLGTSTLGLVEDPEPFLDDSVLEKYGVGLFETEEASRKSVEGAFKWGPGAKQYVHISPLAQMTLDPELVILEVNPEEAMWILYGANYKTGGVQNLPQSGGVAGGCADVTTVVLNTGRVNVTFLGLGCRLKSAIPASNIQLGLPWPLLGQIVDNLEKMKKPIGMLAAANK